MESFDNSETDIAALDAIGARSTSQAYWLAKRSISAVSTYSPYAYASIGMVMGWDLSAHNSVAAVVRRNDGPGYTADYYTATNYLRPVFTLKPGLPLSSGEDFGTMYAL